MILLNMVDKNKAKNQPGPHKNLSSMDAASFVSGPATGPLIKNTLNQNKEITFPEYEKKV
jgi:hypothetical protein